jgi:hypothetical protein
MATRDITPEDARTPQERALADQAAREEARRKEAAPVPNKMRPPAANKGAAPPGRKE